MTSPDNRSPSGRPLKSFGWAERAFAAFCMGIPFFLLVVDTGKSYDAGSDDLRWLYNCGAFAVSMLAVPSILGLVYYGLDRMWADAAAFWTTVIAVVALFLLLLVFKDLFTSAADPTRPSISQYASMNDAQIFGMLLTVPSMIMILNGFIYGDEMKKAAKRASVFSIIAGFGLLGVVVCPYYFILLLHYSWAIVFFVFAALNILVGMGEKKNPKTNVTSVVLMVVALAIGVFNHFDDSRTGEWITLFEAEAIGLWVIGAHYIITSFERTREGRGG